MYEMTPTMRPPITKRWQSCLAQQRDSTTFRQNRAASAPETAEILKTSWTPLTALKNIWRHRSPMNPETSFNHATQLLTVLNREDATLADSQARLVIAHIPGWKFERVNFRGYNLAVLSSVEVDYVDVDELRGEVGQKSIVVEREEPAAVGILSERVESASILALIQATNYNVYTPKTKREKVLYELYEADETIANKLGLSYSTIRSHTIKARTEYGVTNNVDLAICLMLQGKLD